MTIDFGIGVDERQRGKQEKIFAFSGFCCLVPPYPKKEANVKKKEKEYVLFGFCPEKHAMKS